MTVKPKSPGRAKGLWVATLTPLNADLGCDAAALARHCKALLAAGCEGFALFGTTGEGPSFTVAERRAALEAVLKAGVPAEKLIIGAGCSALADTAELCRAAAELGIEGSLVLPPFFFKNVPQEGVFRAYAELVRLCGAANARIYLYNIPGVAAVGFEYATIERLVSAFPERIVGIKDSSLDWSYTEPLLRKFPDFPVLIGAEHHLPQAMAAGCRGTICGIANLAPRLIGRLLRPGADADAARAEVERFIAAAFGGFHFLPAMRSILASRSGNDAWRRVRPTLAPLTAEEEGRLLAGLKGIAEEAAPG